MPFEVFSSDFNTFDWKMHMNNGLTGFIGSVWGVAPRLLPIDGFTDVEVIVLGKPLMLVVLDCQVQRCIRVLILLTSHKVNPTGWNNGGLNGSLFPAHSLGLVVYGYSYFSIKGRCSRTRLWEVIVPARTPGGREMVLHFAVNEERLILNR